MPVFNRDDIQIYFEDNGSGFPILFIAPGGMRSSIPMWKGQAWNPIEQLASSYRVIAMDQRNAGRSNAPIRASDGWHVYKEDQLALLDHLGVDRFHIVGMCIGGPYGMGLIQAVPQRVASFVIFQSIGLFNNRDVFFGLFDSWADELKPSRPEVCGEIWAAFKKSMFQGEFLFNVSREFVSQCETPMLVLQGNDQFHPAEISKEIVSLAPNATLVEFWQEPKHLPDAKQEVERFLATWSKE